MQDAVCVRVVEGSSDLFEDPDDLFQVHWLANPVRKSSPLDQLEHEVGRAVLVAEVEDLDDVRVLQARHRARLLLESLAVFRVLGEEIGQDLDRHVAVEGGVVRAVDGCHAAAADALHDPVRAERHAFLDVHVITPRRMSSATAGGSALSPTEASRTATRGRRRAGASSTAIPSSATQPVTRSTLSKALHPTFRLGSDCLPDHSPMS